MPNQLSLIPINTSEARYYDEFESYLKELGRSEETIRVYVWAIRKYFQYLNSECKASDALAWLSWNVPAQEKRVAGYALRTYRDFLKEFHPELDVHIYVATQLPPTSRPNPKPIDNPEIILKRMNVVAKQILPRDSYLTLRVFMQVLRELGVRRSEAAGVTWNDVNWSDRSVVVHGKGDKKRTLPISRKLSKLLSVLRSRSVVSPWIGAKGQILNSKCLAYLFKEVAKTAGLGNLKCHGFRTTKLTEIGNMPNFNPLLYQAFSGHSDLSTARFYVKPALDRMRDMLNMK